MKLYRVTLTELERIELVNLIASGKYKNTKQKRAQILLGSDESEGGKKMKDEELSKAYDVHVKTVGRVRQRFVEEGYEVALHGKPRPVNREKVLDGRVESQLIALRCSEVPSGSSKWTLRLLAEKMVELEYVESISHESVRQILKKVQSKRGK
ncbi:MAG: helix-turn-helix domain-containing protein [Bacteroidota bacterium]